MENIISIEEQLQRVHLDGEKSPLTSPTKYSSQKHNSSFSERNNNNNRNNKTGKRVLLPAQQHASSNGVRALPSGTAGKKPSSIEIPIPFAHDDHHQYQRQMMMFGGHTNDHQQNLHEYVEYESNASEAEYAAMYAKQMYEYELAMSQMHYGAYAMAGAMQPLSPSSQLSTSSPEQIMPFLASSPTSAAMMMDPNEYARMQQYHQMYASHHQMAVPTTQEMIDIYGMPYHGMPQVQMPNHHYYSGQGGVNGNNNRRQKSYNNSMNISGYYSSNSSNYASSERGGSMRGGGGVDSRGNSRNGKYRKNNNFGPGGVRNDFDFAGSSNGDIHRILSNNDVPPSETLLRFKLLRMPSAQYQYHTSAQNSDSSTDNLLSVSGEYAEFKFNDVIGNCVEFSNDQHGSRFIQLHIESAGDPDGVKFKAILEEISPHFKQLSSDVFGNYVIQKCFERASGEQLKGLLDKAAGEACLDLCLNAYGCRVIQKALDVCSKEQRDEMFLKPLERELENLCCDQNGNHVAQKLVALLSDTGDLEEFVKIVVKDSETVRKLSSHPYGCRVVQRMLEYCTNEQKDSILLPAIVEKTTELAINQFGNYVVQHSLQYGSEKFKRQILRELATEITSLATHKFASNVIEKCMAYCDNELKKIMVDQMLGKKTADDGEKEEQLPKLMSDQYANYVVQKLLEICDEDQFDEFLDRIRVHVPEMRNYAYGKHIVQHVERLEEERKLRATTEATA